jgi:hypothetical protein
MEGVGGLIHLAASRPSCNNNVVLQFHLSVGA